MCWAALLRRRAVLVVGSAVAVGTAAVPALADSSTGDATTLGGAGISTASMQAPNRPADGVTVSGSWLPRPDVFVKVPGILPPDIDPPIVLRAPTGLFDCEATATPGAVATGITACYVSGSDGTTTRASTQASPGPVDATASGTFSPSSVVSYSICFQAEAVFADGNYVQTQLSCY